MAKGSLRLSIFTTGTGSLPLGLSAVAVAPLLVACSLQPDKTQVSGGYCMPFTAGIILLVRHQHLVSCTPDTLEVLSTDRDTLQAHVYGSAAVKLTGMWHAIGVTLPHTGEHAAHSLDAPLAERLIYYYSAR